MALEPTRRGRCWWDEALPETQPAFGRVLLSSEGQLWVEEFVPEYETRVPQWWVLGAAGEFLERAAFPEEFTPHQIRRSRVLGVSLDELRVNYVERRSITSGR